MTEIAKDVHEVLKNRYWDKDTAGLKFLTSLTLKTRDTDLFKIKQYQYKTNYG